MSFFLFVLLLAISVALLVLRGELKALRKRVAELEFDLDLLGARIVTPAAPADPEATAGTTPPESEPEAAIEETPAAGEIEPEPEPEPIEPPAPPPGPPPQIAEPSPPSGAATPPAAPPAPRVEWERWLGVRGAAVLGGAVLALAAILFFKYTIEHGLIPPAVRVALGAIVGTAAIVASEMLRQRARDYFATANALAGAGIVILYASIWAARALYQLIPVAVAFPLMALVTLACGLLAWRHASLVVAVLGLIGGFATPLLLATERDNPIGLFGYILLLDIGLLTLARRRRWPVLGLLGLVGTALFQMLWIGARMGPDRLFLGLVILGVFAVLFAISQGRKSAGAAKGEGSTWDLSRAGAVLVPFGFSLYLAGRAELGPRLYPIAALLLLLSLLALWLERRGGMAGLGAAAAAADIGVIAVWASRSALGTTAAWEMVAVSVALGLTFHVAFELDRRVGAGGDEKKLALGPVIAGSGFFALLILTSVSHGSSAPWAPWLTGWLVLAALLVRQSREAGRGYLAIIAAIGLAIAWVFYPETHRPGGLPPAPLYLGLAAATAVAFQLLALARRGSPSYRLTEIAAGALALGLLLGQADPVYLHGSSLPLFFAYGLFLMLMVSLSATRLASGKLYLLGVAALAFGHLIWSSRVSAEEPRAAAIGLAMQFFAVILATAWPLATGPRLAGRPFALYAMALAGPFWFLSLKALFEARFGDTAIGLLPLGLALLSLGAAFQARRLLAAYAAEQKRSLVWLLAVTLAFVGLAIPLQLEKEWITIGWALQGLAVLALWRRLDHPGLKWFGLALLAAATLRLVANPALLGYYPRSSWRIFNWLMYSYLVPAAALVGSFAILRPLEVRRLTRIEKRFYPALRALASDSCGLAAIVVIFFWINLTIFDFFSSDPVLSLSFERLPARDLSLSLAWVVYSVLLLALGMARNSVGLRWISLGFLIVSIGKVFLYDLGELEDLYRVASLAGLAISLLLVSLAYQRFVFGNRTGGES